MTVDPARARSFGRTAELYEIGRPGYPHDLLRQIFDEIAAESGSTAPQILDVGAGTGKLSRQLVEFGSVVAVEPLDEMREQFQIVVPDVTCMAGSAESIPLPDASVDVVTVGQAYHWFDQQRANPEISRVLRDGGWLVALWNSEDPEVPWVAALEEIMTRDDAHPHEPRMDWPVRFTNAPWFSELVRREGTMVLSRTKAQLLSSMESHSYLSVRSEADRQPVLDEVARLIADFPDPFDVPFVTEAFLCRKQPASAS